MGLCIRKLLSGEYRKVGLGSSCLAPGYKSRMRNTRALISESAERASGYFGKYGIENKLCFFRRLYNEIKLCGWCIGVIAAKQAHRQSRHLADWKHCHGDLKDVAEQAKREADESQKKEKESRLALEEMRGRMGRVEDLESEVASLRTDLLQVKKQLANKEFELVSKENELANKEKELAHKGSELEKKQDELLLQGGDLEKARAELGKFAQKIREIEEVAVGTCAALNHSKDVRKYLMATRVREIMEKIFASHKFGYYMAGLVPRIQTIGCDQLLEMLKE